MTKKTKKKTVKKSASKKVSSSKPMQREHRGFVIALALFVGFSSYALTSILDSNMDFLRYQASVLSNNVTGLDRLVEEEPAFAEAPFTDVDEAHKNFEAISQLYFDGVINGFPDGSFHPERKIKRAEFISILTEAKSSDFLAVPADKLAYCATDVKDVPEHWFAPSSCFAKHLGWISGYSDGSLGVGLEINRPEALKIAMTAFGLEIPDNSEVEVSPFSDVKADDWYVGVASAAKLAGLLDGMVEFNAKESITRGETVQLIYDVRALSEKE